jgi:acyl-CoA thioesterase
VNVKAALSPDDLARACADAMWKEDDASKGLGMEILKIRPGEAVLAMTVLPNMVNGHGIAHGGFHLHAGGLGVRLCLQLP